MRWLCPVVVVGWIVVSPPVVGSATEAGVEAMVAEARVADLQRLMADGTLTAEAITRAYLGRIERLDEVLRSSWSTRRPSPTPAHSTTSGGADGCAARCTGFRSCSRTTSRRATRCRPRPARSPWRAT